MAVPPIIDLAEFEAVQVLLKSRSPTLTAPRIVSGPTLLTGICFCAACGGAMTLRTGKSGQYRNYKNGGFWRARFCTELVSPTGFEPVLPP